MTILSFLISLLAVGSAVQPLSPDNRTLLKDLVGKFDSLDVYENRKIAKIQMKKEACKKLEGREQMEAWLDVAYEYSYFDSDSTIAALEHVKKMASDASDHYMAVKTATRMSRILTTLGYYKESSDIIDSIDKKTIPQTLLFEYFEVKEFLCYELFHVDGSRLEFQDMYEEHYRAYMDSVILYAPENSEYGLRSQEKKALILNDYDYAMQCNRKRMELAPKGSIAESFVFYERNIIYEKMGGCEEERIRAEIHRYIFKESANRFLRNTTHTGFFRNRFSENAGIGHQRPSAGYRLGGMVRSGNVGAHRPGTVVRDEPVTGNCFYRAIRCGRDWPGRDGFQYSEIRLVAPVQPEVGHHRKGMDGTGRAEAAEAGGRYLCRGEVQPRQHHRNTVCCRKNSRQKSFRGGRGLPDNPGRERLAD